MARRKEAPKVVSASSRSTASIFQNIESPDQIEESEPPIVEPNQEVEERDSPDEYKFPFNLLAELQDFLNDHLNFCRGVELLVCLYLCQIFYFYMTKKDDMPGLTVVGFSIAGATLAMYLSHRSLKKRHAADPENVKYPELPDFNIIYGFLIPIMFSVLLGSTKSAFFQMNLAMNNFSIHSLHTVAKVLSAFVFYYIYNENLTIQVFEFVQVVWIYFSVEWTLCYCNEQIEVPEDEDEEVIVKRTLSNTEVHLIAVFVVNMLANFHVPLSETTIPLFIVRGLLLALACGLAVLYPFYWATSSLSNPVLRNIGALVVTGAFGTSFYLLMNYVFVRQVYNVEVVTWLYNYILLSELRVHLLAGWVLGLAVAIPVVFTLSVNNTISLNSRRKAWHYILFASLAYPALVKEPVFTSIAVLGSVFLFIVLEMVRASRLGWMGNFINSQLRYFQDEKDSKGPLSLSYIFLLVGVAIPIAYGVAVEDIVSPRSYIGLVTLGLSDSSASIVGKNLGITKWKGGDRTVAGSVTYVVVTLASFFLINVYLLPEGSKIRSWENMFIVAVLGAAVEGASTLNDNILVPCMSLIAYELLSGTF